MTSASPEPIRRLSEADAAEVHELLRVTWRDTYAGILPEEVILDAERVWHSKETLQRQMKNKDVLFAGYIEGGRLLGLLRAAMAGEDTLRVFQLYVLPSEQRKGIGSALMDHAKHAFPKARKISLDVARGNGKGISFYAGYGFKVTGESTMKIAGHEIHNLDCELTL